jgi:hypothetical protein
MSEKKDEKQSKEELNQETSTDGKKAPDSEDECGVVEELKECGFKFGQYPEECKPGDRCCI